MRREDALIRRLARPAGEVSGCLCSFVYLPQPLSEIGDPGFDVRECFLLRYNQRDLDVCFELGFDLAKFARAV
jgi:hypothetical protein